MNSTLSLLQQVKQCTLCTHSLPYPPKPILQLHNRAKILIIGQAPGLLAHKNNRPFTDKSGERLKQWLGVDDTAFYNEQLFAIMPMAFCYPGKQETGSGDKPPPKICQQTWHQKVRSHLTNVQMVILIGQYAAKHYLPSFVSLTNAVKQNTTSQDSIIVMPHPSPRNNIWLAKNPWFETKTLPLLRQRIRQIC